MVKPEDLPRFVGHIHAEAARLVTLIDDIIRLTNVRDSVASSPEAAAARKEGGHGNAD